MAWDVEVSDEFKQWYERLNLVEQESIAVGVMLLEAYGPALGRPQVDTLRGAAFPT